MGTTKIKCAKRLISHGLPLHTLHNAIYYLLPPGIGTGWVFQRYLYPYPHQPVSAPRGTSFDGCGWGVLKNPGVHKPIHGYPHKIDQKTSQVQCECQLTLPCRPARLGRSCVMGLVTRRHRACRSRSLMRHRHGGTLSMRGLSESRWSSGSWLCQLVVMGMDTDTNMADRGRRGVSSIVVGWVLLLAVLDPAHTWPVVGIDMELAIPTRHDGVGDERGSRGDISTTRKCGLFHTPNRYPIPWPFVLFCHLHTCLNSFNNETQCLHPSLEGRGNVAVMSSVCAGFLG